MESQSVNDVEKLKTDISVVKENIEENIRSVSKIFGGRKVRKKWVKMDAKGYVKKNDLVYVDDLFSFKNNKVGNLPKQSVETAIKSLERSIQDAVNFMQKNSKNRDLFKIICSVPDGGMSGNSMQEYGEDGMESALDSILHNYTSENLMLKNRAKTDLLKILIPNLDKIELVLSVIKSELYNYLLTNFDGKRELSL